MATVETIIAELQESSEWEDGESLAAIRSRLTAGQLQGPGTLVLRISERGPLPSLLCGLVLQSGTALFEVKCRLPANVTSQDIDKLVQEWQAAGYLERITINQPPGSQE